MKIIKVGSGKTPKGATDWKSYGDGVSVEVQTSEAAFQNTPVYISSLAGDSRLWDTTGASSIYTPRPDGFRLYVRNPEGTPITPEKAQAWNWHVEWSGYEEVVNDRSLMPALDAMKRQLAPVFWAYDQLYDPENGDKCPGDKPVPTQARQIIRTADQMDNPPWPRCYIYDSASCLIAMVMAGEKAIASQIAALLDFLTIAGDSDTNAFGGLGDYVVGADEPGYTWRTRHSGNVAWAGYSLAFYQKYTGDTQYGASIGLIGRYLARLQETRSESPMFGLIKAGFKNGDKLEFAAVEHNIDSYFFFKLASSLGVADFENVAKGVKDGLLRSAWDNVEGRFYRGVNSNENAPDKTATLDVNSWGALFLLSINDDAKAGRALEYVEKFYNEDSVQIGEEVFVYKGYKPYNSIDPDTGIDWSKKNLSWSEGNLGVALAYLRYGDVKKYQQIVDDTQSMQISQANGMFLYASHTIGDFIRDGRAAGTNWYVISRMSQSVEWLNSFWGPV